MRNNKLLIALIIGAAVLILYKIFVNISSPRLSSSTIGVAPKSLIVSPESVDSSPILPGEVEKKLVIRQGTLSLVVKNLEEVRDKIVSFVESKQGYLISSDIFGVENDARATVIVRIPEDKFTETLSYIRQLGLKVSNESVTGADVTEEYVDLQGRLKSLEASRNRFKEILQNATTVDQILTVQREIDRVQMDIEQTTGRIEYLSKSSAMSKIVVNLAIDEESLPYIAPSEKWRPALVFKEAIRSLLAILKNLSYLVIWVVVFSVIWIPALVVAKILWRFVSQGRAKPPKD